MTIDTSYRNIALNTGSFGTGTTMPAQNNLIAGNPFITNMQRTAAIMGAQYQQMNAQMNTMKAQMAAQMAAQAKANAALAASRQNTFGTFNTGNINTNNSSIWTNPRQNTSSSFNIQDTDSDLKPGLFKGALAGKEALVTRLCRKYGVDPALVASIIGLESGWGTSNLAYHNNFGGLRKTGDLGANANGFGYFSTTEKGLEAMIKNLASYSQRFSDVKNVDFANLDAIGRHYCDASWAPKVREMYNSNVRHYLA